MPTSNSSDQALRIVFAGTPDFAVPTLQALIDSNTYRPLAVYTQPDRPAGRGRQLTPSPVKQAALAAGIPVQQVASFKTEAAQETLRQLQPDLLIVIAYGLILPASVLAIPRLGGVNVHASLLPRFRGAAPIQRALLAGDNETGITLMTMTAGLDEGPMLATSVCPITDDETGASLHDKLAVSGAQLLIENLPALFASELLGQPQADEQACYASKLTKAEAEIDWQWPAAKIERAVRAYHGWPVAFTHLEGQRIRVWQVRLVDPDDVTHENVTYKKLLAEKPAPGTIIDSSSDAMVVVCGDGTSALALERLQLSGGKVLPVAELLKAKQALFARGLKFQQNH